MDRKPIVIRKYENRRLYDTVNSRYINLDEVAQLVKEGREIQVVDAATGEDLTRLVLTQIIMDDAKDAGSAFPLDILRQMVIASGRATQESALNYVKAMFDMYQNAYRVMSPPNPFEFVQPQRRAEPVSGPPPEGAPPDEVDQLKRRVSELEALVSRVAPATKKRSQIRGRKRRK